MGLKPSAAAHPSCFFLQCSNHGLWVCITFFLVLGILVLNATTQHNMTGVLSQHVRFELDFATFPPRRLCVDNSPWQTALRQTVGQINEDAGCEGRYNSGYGLGLAGGFVLMITLMRLPWCHALAAVLYILLMFAFLGYCISATGMHLHHMQKCLVSYIGNKYIYMCIYECAHILYVYVYS